MELTLPISGLIAKIEPMRAKEEKMLTDKKLVKKGKTIDAILLSCIRLLNAEKPTEKHILDLCSGDRNFLLYHLRIISYGEELETDVSCPHCKKESHYVFDLEELLSDGTIEVKAVPEGGLTKDITLSNGAIVTVTNMDGHRERRLRNKEDDLTVVDVTMACVQSIDGESVTATAMDEFIGKDLAAIRKASKDVLCGLIPSIKVECENCDRKHDFILTASNDFFIH